MKTSLIATLLCFTASVLYAGDNTLRPPAVPLVVHDPYFSIWSPADKLTDADTIHWTERKHSLHAMIRVDGKPYRLMGAEPANVPAMEQTGLTVTPTRTIYNFESDEVMVKLEFITPILPDCLDLLSRTATFIVCSASSKGNTPRRIAFYFDAGAEIAVNLPAQIVEWETLDVPNTTSIKLGTVEQSVLGKRGDNRPVP